MNRQQIDRFYLVVYNRRANVSRANGWWKPIWHSVPKVVTVETRIIAEDRRHDGPRGRYWYIARRRVWIRYHRDFRYLSKEIAWRLS